MPDLTMSMFATPADYWENEAKRYAGNADYWREKAQAAEADAERYRWLRSRLPGAAYRVAGVIYSEGGPGVDAGIDAAMASARGVGAA